MYHAGSLRFLSSGADIVAHPQPKNPKVFLKLEMWLFVISGRHSEDLCELFRWFAEAAHVKVRSRQAFDGITASAQHVGYPLSVVQHAGQHVEGPRVVRFSAERHHAAQRPVHHVGTASVRLPNTQQTIN